MTRRGIPLALLVGFAILLPVWWPVAFGYGDHLVFWAAGHSIVAGGSPYERGPWIALAQSYPSAHLEFVVQTGAEIWVSPPWTAFLFVPFALLPLDLGLWALHVSYVAASIAVTAMLIDLASWRTSNGRALAALLAVTFQPLVIAGRWGQFTSWTLLGTVLALAALRRTNAGPLLVGAVLAVGKPQFAALPGLALAAVLVRRRAWRALLITAGVLVTMAIVTFALQPLALGAMSSGVGFRTGTFELFPTTWGFARLIAPEAWPLALAVLLAVGVVASIGAVWSAAREQRDEVLVCAALALGVLLTPYALTYEHALLLPALVAAAAAADRCTATVRAALLAGLVVITGAAWGTFVFTTGAALGFLPVATVALFGAANVAARGRR